MEIKNYIHIDFTRGKDIVVPSIQYDSGTRWVMAKLYDNGLPIDLQELKVCIVVVKPDGKEIFNDCKVINAEKGIIEFEITKQMGILVGEVECQIKLFGPDQLLSSNIFKLAVTKTLNPSSESSKDELDVLVNALGQVQDIDNRFAQINAQLSETKQELSSQLDSVMSVSVTKFGAIGDGITDNSKAFQEAVNYARDNNISRVTVPEGKYNFVSSTVIVPNRIDIEGICNAELINSLKNFTGANAERHRCIFLFMAEYEEDVYSGASGEYLMKVPTAINEVSNENLNTNIITVPTSFTTVDGRIINQSMPSLKIGDEIRVVSYNNWMGRSLQGEFHKIKEINGSSITLEEPLKYPTDVSSSSPWRKLYQTEPDSLGFYTDNGIRPNVLNYPYQGFYKITPCENNIKNLKFTLGEIEDKVAGRYACLYLGSKNSTVKSCEFDVPLWFMDCQDMKLKDSILRNTKHWLGNGGSGLIVENSYFDNSILILEEGCNNFKINNNTFRKDTTKSYDSPILIYSKAREGEVVNNNILSSANRSIEIVNSVGRHIVKNNISNSLNSAIFLQNPTTDMDVTYEITDNILRWRRNQCFALKATGNGDVNGIITNNTLLGDSSAVYLKDGTKDVNLMIENKDKNGNILKTVKTVNAPNKGSYLEGDIVVIDDTYFKCTRSGNFDRNVLGLTITITNLSAIAIVNDVTNLKIGDIINANGLPGRYKIINIYDNKIELYPTPRTNISSAPMFLSGAPMFEII